jgi:hypothetical protein
MWETVISLMNNLANNSPVRAQHEKKYTEVQEQELDVNYICEILFQCSITGKKE